MKYSISSPETKAAPIDAGSPHTHALRITTGYAHRYGERCVAGMAILTSSGIVPAATPKTARRTGPNLGEGCSISSAAKTATHYYPDPGEVIVVTNTFLPLTSPAVACCAACKSRIC